MRKKNSVKQYPIANPNIVQPTYPTKVIGKTELKSIAIIAKAIKLLII